MLFHAALLCLVTLLLPSCSCLPTPIPTAVAVSPGLIGPRLSERHAQVIPSSHLGRTNTLSGREVALVKPKTFLSHSGGSANVRPEMHASPVSTISATPTSSQFSSIQSTLTVTSVKVIATEKPNRKKQKKAKGGKSGKGAKAKHASSKS